MYYPLLRGKQFELLMLREMAEQIQRWGFVPVIEPVKSNPPALSKAIASLINNNCKFSIIINPNVGDHKENNAELIATLLLGDLVEYDNHTIAVCLSSTNTLAQIEQYFDLINKPITLIHKGFTDGAGLARLIERTRPDIRENIFVANRVSILYRAHFLPTNFVLLEDGFKSQNSNKDYPPSEAFSELYLTYEQFVNCIGFGDYLTVGSEFKEGGGPAYAVAIHITYVNPAADNAIAIKHYVSNDVDDPSNPGGKYLQALQKLHQDVHAPNSLIYQSQAVIEFMSLYERSHFPGLGYVKKLSMQHHLELMAHVMLGQ